ncbi:hypothetical protein SAMN05428642_10342 [Flaviramulus basaltis]|uniref:Uncharacterized protein n=1 Tax=Flaviramulus basaltis TaxID=369401 RepID=A0A1K2ILU7_9FLAO|nr:hypothetical protein [Flaviramulus basaltis]SFZ93278.1 hypothetical protein SAMN05428642_10342 [Flaviramulus basaltis]
MKLRRILKIILLICSFVVTGIMVVAVYSLLVNNNTPLNFGMYVNMLICITGILSITYHFKTFKFYKKEKHNKILKDTSLWVSNIIYALLLIYISSRISYSFYKMNKGDTIDSEFYIMYLFCFFVFLLGIFLIIEERWLYKSIKNSETQSHLNGIDNIKGHLDDDL